MKSSPTAWKATLRITGAFVVVAVMWGSVGTGTAQAAAGESVQYRAMDFGSVGAAPMKLPVGWRGEMLAQVNALRASGGVAPLQPCAALRRAAQDYAVVMAQTNAFGHVGPDGAAPWDRMRAKGFAWLAAAENIASGQASIRDVMSEWVESPLHYANLMDPRMKQVGFGFAASSSTGTHAYWVQDFGSGTGC